MAEACTFEVVATAAATITVEVEATTYAAIVAEVATGTHTTGAEVGNIVEVAVARKKHIYEKICVTVEWREFNHTRNFYVFDLLW